MDVWVVLVGDSDPRMPELIEIYTTVEAARAHAAGERNRRIERWDVRDVYEEVVI